MGATEPRPSAPPNPGATAGDAALFVLAPDDAPAGLALSDEAGWNQTLADWDHFLRRGTVYGARDTAGRVVGTAALLPYGPADAERAAWISLVLVTPEHRGRGLAGRMMRACLDEARAADLRPYLDATPAGAAVYLPLGFARVDDLVRLRRPALGGTLASEPAAVPASGPTDLDALLALDREALGIDRSDLLRDLASRPGSMVYRGGKADALCLVRAGRRARQLGPVYAPSPGAAVDLLEAVLARETGELVVDLAARQDAARTALFRRGFALERPFTRMALGAAPPLPDFLVAGAGPEYG